MEGITKKSDLLGIPVDAMTMEETRTYRILSSKANG